MENLKYRFALVTMKLHIHSHFIVLQMQKADIVTAIQLNSVQSFLNFCIYLKNMLKADFPF